MYAKKGLLILSIMILFLSGCSAKKFEIENKEYDQSKIDMKYIEENYELISKNYTDDSSRFMFYFIPFSGFSKLTDSQVIDNYLDDAGGDIVTNVHVENWLFSMISISYYKVTVTGDVWRKK